MSGNDKRSKLKKPAVPDSCALGTHTAPSNRPWMVFLPKANSTAQFGFDAYVPVCGDRENT